jgi:hypothetical protein
VNAQSYANVQNRDLRAFGISLPGMPEVVGHFPTTIFAFTRSRTSSIWKAIADSRPANEPLTRAKWMSAMRAT